MVGLSLVRWGLLLLLGLVASGLPSAGQQTPAQAAGPGVMRITLGSSFTKLTGPWRFHTGDSPLVPGTRMPLWSTPGFQDQGWEAVDLTPPQGAFDPTLGFSDYVKGWTARGHAGYAGYAWYRLLVKVQAPGDGPLALEGPTNVDDVYQVFVNGHDVGSFGTFWPDGRHPTVYVTRPEQFTVPQSDLVRQSDGSYTAVIAFRVWMDPYSLGVQPDVGGMHVAPLLGYAGAVGAEYQLGWWQQVRTFFAYPVLAILFSLLGVVVLSLALLDRADPVYRWLAGTLFLIALAECQLAVICWTTLMTPLALEMMNPLILGAWVMVWWKWFQLRRPAWVPRTVITLSLVYFCAFWLADRGPQNAPASLIAFFHMLCVVLPLIILLLLVLIVVRGVRAHGAEGWLTLPAVFLVGVAQFQQDLDVLHVRVIYFPFGVQISVSDIANVALLAAMFVLLLRRVRLSVNRQRELALDVKQAQEVQHVLLPEPLELSGMRIESDYRPAREVGGDFFQIAPNSEDGSVLVVVGDVAGKGLPAGMLVALLVGAIRSVVELDDNPARMLEALNRRLLGRGDAHATCLALHIAADGIATMANAGHLPPYLNGVEVPMEGCLPLGSMADIEFPVCHFHLRPGDHLVFLSDGVVEAQNRSGELFGFDRIARMLGTARTAAEMAEAAQAFGQEDDISVVSIVCVDRPDPAQAPRALSPIHVPNPSPAL